MLLTFVLIVLFDYFVFVAPSALIFLLFKVVSLSLFIFNVQSNPFFVCIHEDYCYPLHWIHFIAFSWLSKSL